VLTLLCSTPLALKPLLYDINYTGKHDPIMPSDHVVVMGVPAPDESTYTVAIAEVTCALPIGLSCVVCTFLGLAPT
jgi:hypothetical protein